MYNIIILVKCVPIANKCKFYFISESTFFYLQDDMQVFNFLIHSYRK